MSTVRSVIDDGATAYPERVFALAPDDDPTLTWGQLAALGHELDAQLTARGIGAGDKVALLLDNGIATAGLFLGVMYAGRVVVPLNALAGVSQLGYALEHCDARLLLVSPAYEAQFTEAIASVGRPLEIISTDASHGPAWPASHGSDRATAPPSPDDEALLIYTSGTTGVPKGALLTHSAVLAGGRNTTEAHDLGPDDRALCVLPLYHINAQMVTVMGPLVSGGSVVLPSRFSRSQFWQQAASAACTWFSAVPTIFSYLLDATGEALDVARDTQLRFGRSASAALAPAVHRAFEERFGLRIVETMGLTETAAQILSNPMPPAAGKYGSPGRAVGNEVRIAGGAVAAGEKGEIEIRGANVFKGYYKQDDVTATTFTADGWFRTGDIGYMDEDDYVFVTGRIKELIIKGGENIAPREIDDVLYRHPAVREAAAFGIDDHHYGQQVAACVSLCDGADCDPESLRQHCIAALGDYKSPVSIEVLEELPKGPSGKIQRLKLAERAAADKRGG